MTHHRLHRRRGRPLGPGAARVGIAALVLVATYALPGILSAQDTARAPAASDTAAAAPDTSARLVGTVRQRATGEPVAGARVRIGALERQAVTDAGGRFVIGALPTGRFDVRVHHIGITTNVSTVRLESGHVTRAALAVERRVLVLEDLRLTVAGAREVDHLTGFRTRRASGEGVYIDRAEIEERNPYYTADLLRSIPGLDVGPTRYGVAQIRMRRFGSRCRPFVYLDGVPAEGFQVDLLSPSDIAALEIYRGPSEMPPEFNRPTRDCGAIVIWTRGGAEG